MLAGHVHESKNILSFPNVLIGNLLRDQVQDPGWIHAGKMTIFVGLFLVSVVLDNNDLSYLDGRFSFLKAKWERRFLVVWR